MIVTEKAAREYCREKYGIELPEDFHGIPTQWSKKNLEWFDKYIIENSKLDGNDKEGVGEQQ